MSKTMKEVKRGLNFVFCYIDDILIFSQNMEEHFRYLTLVIECLKYYGFILNEKNAFLQYLKSPF